MKKIILMFAIAVSAVGCSKDDDAPTVKKVPVTITMDATDDFLDQTIHLAYDAKGRVSQISSEGFTTGEYNILYGEHDRVSFITGIDSGDDVNMSFTYDSQGRIIDYGEEDAVEHIAYYDGGTFLFEGQVAAKNNNGDLSKFDTGVFHYNTSKKGAFANVKAFNVILFLILDYNSVFYASRKSITELTSTNNSFQYSLGNEFDEEGYISTAEITGSSSYTITYEYTEL